MDEEKIFLLSLLFSLVFWRWGGGDVGAMGAFTQRLSFDLVVTVALKDTVISYNDVLSRRSISYSMRCEIGFGCSCGVGCTSTFSHRIKAIALCTFSSGNGLICRGARRNSILNRSKCAVGMSLRPNSCRLVA